MMLDPGQYDARVTLQSPPTGQNAYGEPSGTWTDADTTWAKATPTAGLEAIHAGADAPAYELKLRLRYRSDVTTAWRVVWSGRTYEITGLADLGGRGEELVLTCKAIG